METYCFFDSNVPEMTSNFYGRKIMFVEMRIFQKLLLICDVFATKIELILQALVKL